MNCERKQLRRSNASRSQPFLSDGALERRKPVLDLATQFVVPVHHQTFRLSWEAMNEPIERFTRALPEAPAAIYERSASVAM